MWGFEPSTYGEGWADVYDDWYPDLTGTDDAVAALDRLAGPRGAAPVFELGIGTGRLALPLAALGHDVRGIDASPAMLERLAAKPGAGAVAVVLGDMAEAVLPTRPDDPDPGPRCALVFAAYNTFLNLADEEAQRRCLVRSAALLAPGGRLVVEAYVPPDPGGNPPAEAAARQTVSVHRLTADRLVLAADVVDPQAQTVRGQFVELTEGGVRLRPYLVRYLTPDQLDVLAAGAGLALEARWGDWRATPFSAEHATQVSIYRRAGGPA